MLIHLRVKEIFSHLHFHCNEIHTRSTCRTISFLSFFKQLSFSHYITYLHSFSIFVPVTPLAMNLYFSLCKSSVSKACPQVHDSSPCLPPHRSLIHSPSSTIHLSPFGHKLYLSYTNYSSLVCTFYGCPYPFQFLSLVVTSCLCFSCVSTPNEKISMCKVTANLFNLCVS